MQLKYPRFKRKIHSIISLYSMLLKNQNGISCLAYIIKIELRNQGHVIKNINILNENVGFFFSYIALEKRNIT